MYAFTPMMSFCFSIGKIFIVAFLLVSCCVKDPTCTGDTSLSPGNFWQSKEERVKCPCNYPWEQDLESTLAPIQQTNVQVADLIDVALLMNPLTQLTWANARAAAYNVGIAESALYPTVFLSDQLIYSDTEFDDGPLMTPLTSTGTMPNGTPTTTTGIAPTPPLSTCPPSLSHQILKNPGAFVRPGQLIRSKKHAFDSLLMSRQVVQNPNQVPTLNANIVTTNLLNTTNTTNTANMANTINPINTTNTANTTNNTNFINFINTATPVSSQSIGNNEQMIGPSRLLIHDLSVSYLLLDFGGRAASIEAAKQALYNSNWIHNRQIQQVIISVLQAYYNYIGTTYLLTARYSDLENAQKNYESAKAQFEAGVRNKLDVLQAETSLINIELSIVQLQGQKEVDHGVLANTLGLPANEMFYVPEINHFHATDVISEKVDQLIEEAIKRRPDLAAAYAAHAQRKAQVVVARSQGLPTLGSLVELQEFNNMRNGSFNTHTISGSLMLSAPIFSGFLYVNEERQAQELVRASCATIRNIQINVTLDVVTSYFNFKTAVKSLSYSEKYLKFSEETYEAALLSYYVGVGSILDLLSAQQTLADARAQLIQARTQWAVTLSNLSFAMGTTGTDEEIKPWKIQTEKTSKDSKKTQVSVNNKMLFRVNKHLRDILNA